MRRWTGVSSIFETYVETQRVPTLEKGDIVIMDNLPAHKSPIAEKAILDRGAAVLFLPPYSPDPHCQGK
jgi:transposase